MHLTQDLKQLAGTAVMPLFFALLAALAGALLRLFGWRRVSNALWIFGSSVVYLSSIAPVADALLGPLEGSYPPLGDLRDLPPVGYIVVLGSDYSRRDGIPITAALSGDALTRIAEGVRLTREMHGVRLVASGGASGQKIPSAAGYAEFAADFGIDATAIDRLDQPLDTGEEAAGVAALVGKSPFILVTSAYHMRRAMRLMHLAGLNPIAAPTGQLVPRHADYGARAWIPSAASLQKTERALHEYAGLAIAR